MLCFSVVQSAQSKQKLTFDSARDVFPSWSSDGEELVFRSLRQGGGDLFVRSADGGGEARTLVGSLTARYLIYSEPCDVLLLLVDPYRQGDENEPERVQKTCCMERRLAQQRPN